MPRGVFNWTFDDAVKFLRAHGFSLVRTEGSHYFYAGYQNGKPRLVHVQFHGKASLKPRTIKSIIAQSGIPKEEWIDT
ncbi:MAG: type II toxin-antitoxin system HicA family toxin [Candidatus Kerfeldbacteria bacterium]|nr:type II toxin-antitoxin system HicA family toxin [Candidatus Kerfeldbacteria bacterium]